MTDDTESTVADQPHHDELALQGSDRNSSTILLVIAVIFGIVGSICVLSGFGYALASIFDPDMMADQPWREGDPFMRVLLVLMAVFSMTVGVGLVNYAYILFRRATWEGPGRYDPFRGTYGWFTAIGGLVISGGFLVLFVVGPVAMMIGKATVDGEAIVAMFFALWLFGFIWKRCWAGLKQLRSEDQEVVSQ